MSGAQSGTNGISIATNGEVLNGDNLRRTTAAWERFSAGAETVQGVRPEILMSWYRCREEYEVDPLLDRAPAAAEVGAHSIDHDVVFAELGGVAACAAREVDGLDGLVTVADPKGRILATWGNRRLLNQAVDANLAPWSAWAEWASGTNGMGTALESRRPIVVRGPEHWCRGFQEWVCAGVAVRDVVTHEPLAVLNVSCWRTSPSDAVLPWLARVVAATESKLRQRAHHSGTLLAAAFADARVAPGTPLAVVDLAGSVVLANSEAAALMGTPSDAPALSPAHRWTSQLPTLPRLARHAVARARQEPGWTGATQVYVPFLGTSVPVAAHPVFTGSQVIGVLLVFGSLDGPAASESALIDPGSEYTPARPMPNRVVAQRDDRLVLLDPREVRFAEADHNMVWLTSDQGRLVAATRGLDRLEQQLEGKGFLRVHRRFLVNLSRVREVEQGFKGALFLTTDARPRETIPVARRHAPQLRQAPGSAAPAAPGGRRPRRVTASVITDPQIPIHQRSINCPSSDQLPIEEERVRRYLAEFVGTFFLVFTVCLTGRAGTALAALAIGAVLAAMVFATGHISGGHVNPAVTLAVFLRGRLPARDVAPYWLAQVVGGLAAAGLSRFIINARPTAVSASGRDLAAAFIAELIFTFALAFVVLNVATSKDHPNNSFYGLAIGLIVLSGAVAVGHLSGGAFNPAVGLGMCLAGLASWSMLWVYLVATLAGGAVAGYAFRALNPDDLDRAPAYDPVADTAAPGTGLDGAMADPVVPADSKVP